MQNCPTISDFIEFSTVYLHIHKSGNSLFIRLLRIGGQKVRYLYIESNFFFLYQVILNMSTPMWHFIISGYFFVELTYVIYILLFNYLYYKQIFKNTTNLISYPLRPIVNLQETLLLSLITPKDRVIRDKKILEKILFSKKF